MAKISSSKQLVPSILDRLIDEEPENRREAPKSRNQVLRELKQSVRRDLENLLNTRYRCSSWPPNLDELDASLVNYGIPDFSATKMGAAASREEFRQVVERVIRTFEPRFKAIRVVIQENSDKLDRTLRFKIEAVLYAEPAPEPVTFQSQVEPTTGEMEIKTED